MWHIEQYRSYNIRRDRRGFYAIPAQKDGECLIEIGSRSISKLRRYIDDIWKFTDLPLNKHPRWMQRIASVSIGHRICPDSYKQCTRNVCIAAIVTASLFLLPKLADFDRDGHITFIDAHMMINSIASLVSPGSAQAAYANFQCKSIKQSSLDD